ncbi:class I SAM-dependent methyltransferase [Winogradskyella sp.]|uniref:class I SAM-dependent methyltransferase n=1 Tax=Winogradskyella sp. TaxID=1883156 RepID=UPI003F6AB552
MRLYLKIVLLTLLISPLSRCAVKEHKKQDHYTYKKGDPNGTGKWYLGREIAYVMGFQGIEWLERPEREKEENTSKLISNMSINSTDVIADIGAGSGYHVYKIAPLAKEGKVYAVDIQKEMLAAIITHPSFEVNNNIETVLGSEKSINLPNNSVDKVLMVDVYHEFGFPYEMMLSIKKSLRKNGKIYLIEYRGEDKTVPIKKVHKMTEAQAIKEMKAVGFELDENISNLPWQHCMVFVKRK